MNPDNAAKSAGTFKEGFVRVDKSCYKVWQAEEVAGRKQMLPVTALVWNVTRLNEDQVPLVDEHDEPITEEIKFSFGTKALPFVHPAKADSVDDDDPQDMGTEVGVEGNTLYTTAADWTPHELSGVMQLTTSLKQQGVDKTYLNRCWAPDWVGCVFFMKTHVSDNKMADDKGVERNVNYKVVSKIVVGPGQAKPSRVPRAIKSNTDAESVLAPVIENLSETLDGQQLTRKAFQNRVRAALEARGTDIKMLVPCLSLCKDEKWLAMNANRYGFSVDSDSITFTPAAVTAEETA
jgi:hypothetical protein